MLEKSVNQKERDRQRWYRRKSCNQIKYEQRLEAEHRRAWFEQ